MQADLERSEMPTHHEQFDAAFAACPLIAILRGIKPDRAAGLSIHMHAESSYHALVTAIDGHLCASRLREALTGHQHRQSRYIT